MVRVLGFVDQILRSQGPSFGPTLGLFRLRLMGSRVDEGGEPRPDSDLDVLLEYEGNAREDEVFAVFNAPEFELDGIPLDFFPHSRLKHGDGQFTQEEIGASV